MEHKPLLMGYLDNLPTTPYKRYNAGSSANVDLIDVPEEYNVIVVSTSLMEKQEEKASSYNDKYQKVPCFKAINKSNGEFREQVDHLTLKGRQVLLNLGGPYFNPLSLSNSLNTELDIELLDEGIYNIVNRYGFRGICLDLDRDIFHNKRNQVLIPAALKSLKDGYKSIGEDFFICIASYFPDLRDEDKSLPYLAELEGYYDLVCTKFYNRDNDHNGHWIDELGEFITENNHKQKENFLYYTMDFLTNGKRGYPKIPHDKLVMGLPATQDASPKGYVKDPSALLNALERLKQSGTPIRGLAAHSINWEVGEDKDGQPYSYEFMNRYKGIITPI